MRSAIEDLLAAAGCRVIAVEDGVAAWEILADSVSRNEIAVLATDMDMPRMGGRELIRRVRAMEAASGAASRLPILVISAQPRVSSPVPDEVDAWLQKPFTSEALIEQIELLAPGLARPGGAITPSAD